jgi:hypothetical protein
VDICHSRLAGRVALSAAKDIAEEVFEFLVLLLTAEATTNRWVEPFEAAL